jgi:uncharacterized membrane protein
MFFSHRTLDLIYTNRIAKMVMAWCGYYTNRIAKMVMVWCGYYTNRIAKMVMVWCGYYTNRIYLDHFISYPTA